MCTGGEDLPRSYLIKQCKDDLNKMCHITRTPGAVAGAQLDFDAELESVLNNNNNNNNETYIAPISIRLSSALKNVKLETI